MTPNFTEVNKDLTGDIIHKVNLHMHDLLDRQQITKGTCKYLTTDIGKAQLFYMLSKILKGPINPPGRPSLWK